MLEGFCRVLRDLQGAGVIDIRVITPCSEATYSLASLRNGQVATFTWSGALPCGDFMYVTMGSTEITPYPHPHPHPDCSLDIGGLPANPSSSQGFNTCLTPARSDSHR